MKQEDTRFKLTPEEELEVQSMLNTPGWNIVERWFEHQTNNVSKITRVPIFGVSDTDIVRSLISSRVKYDVYKGILNIIKTELTGVNKIKKEARNG